MKRKNYLFFALIIFAFLFNTVAAQQAVKETELVKKIRAIKGVTEVNSTRFDTTVFKEAYEIMF